MRKTCSPKAREIRSLERTLIDNLPWNKARIKFVTRFLLALYAMRTINLSILATAFSGHAKEESNYKRLQRFVRGFEMPYAELALFIVKLLGVAGPGALKSRGFNLEDMHLKDSERLSRVLGLLALAFTWAFVVGLWQARVKELKLKKHGYPPKSIFRRGLDILRRLVTNFGHFDVTVWGKVIKLLSCSWGELKSSIF